ncbi:MAG: hypothetical protein M3680_32000 [Myxococcota bacterium]|nr:hypothetical protein [Myxococcota bacterium]
MKYAPVVCALVATTVAAPACSEREPPPRPTARDPQPPRRVIEPPTGIVRPLPPHAIRADGVGPYKLGDKVASLLQQLASGPRIVRFEIPGIVRTSLIRAEDDTVLIGGETTSTATFVAVVGAEVARTESGVHVGSTRDELTRALGPLVQDPDRARDPRLVIPSGSRNLRVVLEQDRVAAIVVTGELTAAREVPAAPCTPPEVAPTSEARTFAACLSANGEVVEVSGDEVTVRGGDGVARMATLTIPNLLFAAPLRNLTDGRDELVVVTRADEPQDRRWSVVGYRLEGSRFVKVIEGETVYMLSSAQTRWIGADLREVDLYLELTARPDGLEVGGLLTTRTDATQVRDVAVISPVVVRRRPGKATAPDPVDAGAPGPARPLDAGSANP